MPAVYVYNYYPLVFTDNQLNHLVARADTALYIPKVRAPGIGGVNLHGPSGTCLSIEPLIFSALLFVTQRLLFFFQLWYFASNSYALIRHRGHFPNGKRNSSANAFSIRLRIITTWATYRYSLQYSIVICKGGK